MPFNSTLLRQLVTILYLFHLNHHHVAVTTITGSETDHLALLAIKSLLHDRRGVTSSWSNSIDLCQWRGVTCTHQHQRINKLDLRNQSIVGALRLMLGTSATSGSLTLWTTTSVVKFLKRSVVCLDSNIYYLPTIIFQVKSQPICHIALILSSSMHMETTCRSSTTRVWLLVQAYETFHL